LITGVQPSAKSNYRSGVTREYSSKHISHSNPECDISQAFNEKEEGGSKASEREPPEIVSPLERDLPGVNGEQLTTDFSEPLPEDTTANDREVLRSVQ
jgi:hypothetical protein